MRPKPSRPKEVERLAYRLGFVFERQNGGHRVYRRADGRSVAIAFHPGDIPRMTLKKIIRELEISVEQFNEMV